MQSTLVFVVVAAVAVAVVAAGILLRHYELAYAARLRTQIEHEAQASSRALRDLKYAIDQASIVAITDQRGRITYVNDNFCSISKYSRDELIGQDHRIINSGYHPSEFIRDLWVTIANGGVWKGEIRNRAKDGTLYWVDTTIVPFLDEGGKPYQYLSIRNDITRRKLAEAKLVSQAAMAKLGELGAMVAHEVRNPLAGIRGGLQVLQQRAHPTSEDRAVITEMLRRLEALNDRVTDLLRYAEPRPPRLSDVELMPVLAGVVDLLGRDARMKAVRVDLHGDTAWVRGDSEWLHEVFLNLLINAAEAMDLTGTITVAVACAGEAVEVTIQDRGPGIAHHLREQVFEPFFTTKRLGTGLGLAIVRRLIEVQNGSIVVADSSTGARMLIRLKRVEPLRQTTRAASTAGQPA